MKIEKLVIDSLAYGGEGVARLEDGRACFVSGAFPGDVANVKITEQKDRFARGVVQELLEPSGMRVAPKCDDAACGRCGGCPWAAMGYEHQLSWKRQMVVDALEHIAKIDASEAENLVEECLSSKRQWNYRNKVEFVVGQDVAGRFTLGMHAQAGDFVPLAKCHLITEKLSKMPKALTGALRFVAGDRDLKIERVGVRASRRTNDIEIALWTEPGKFPRANAANILSKSVPVKRPAISRVLVKEGAKKRKIAGVESLAGKSFWTEQIDGRIMGLSAPSFFQVNTAQAEKLIALVMEMLEPDGLDNVMDLYSGAGTFTLPLAEEAANVQAIEMEGSSIRDLRHNLERNGLFAEVVGGDVAHELSGLGSADKVVVDPPRSGLGKIAIEALDATGARRIAYVSCNPSTLARDLLEFSRMGFQVRRVVPVDMFPQTYHVETVTLLER